MMNDLLTPHLLDILDSSASRDLILGGGFGLYLKRRNLIGSEMVTLARDLPSTRATVDLDFFLKLEVFLDEGQGKAIRLILDTLGYSAAERHWQFSKPFGDGHPEQNVLVDLLARLPPPGSIIKVKSLRVGSGSHIGLHGRETPEAFAVEDHPITVEVKGLRTDGSAATNSVLVPHPYSWLNMKIRAAHDWHLWRQGKELRVGKEPRSSKHAFDACLIMAMITESELEQAVHLANQYHEDPIAFAVRDEAIVLFSSASSVGWQEAVRQSDVDLDHGLIWPAMVRALGIE